MKFSDRMEVTKVKTVIQKDSIDEGLRNQLWNFVKFYFWDQNSHTPYSKTDPLYPKLISLWHLFFQKPIDVIPEWLMDSYTQLRTYFLTCEWYDVYNFIEFLVIQKLISDSEEFKKSCNYALQTQLSAYRFVGDHISPITSQEEIGAIDDALKDTTPINPVHKHLDCALQLFSDKKKPDYRNTIKESISAVESVCKLIKSEPNVTLDKALNLLSTALAGKGIPLHPALKGAFEKLYGYTSAADGIRHGLMDDPKLDSEDAKFMLVACSAFVSYLIVKSQKAGIMLEENNGIRPAEECE